VENIPVITGLIKRVKQNIRDKTRTRKRGMKRLAKRSAKVGYDLIEQMYINSQFLH